MDQVSDFADSRLLVGCLYCGGPAETRDHVPSKLLLDAPLPGNLPVVGACFACNNGFAADEEYVACLLEAAVAGTTDPDSMRRPVVANILRRVPKLRSRIEAARTEIGGTVSFIAEEARLLNVVLKLARGHAAFELSKPLRDEPTYVRICPLATLSEEEQEAFDDAYFPHILPEVGSRASQRMMVIQPRITGPQGSFSLPGLIMQDWQDVQEDRYSYLATDDGDEVRVRMLIAGYLACDVRWAQ